mmetsp:Transcript_11856/g.21649  ORF Transcript_11856/g.21649 Transcript_11856/m.21649 type:complete len:624 (+) Transcript_11856:78-1949(+)
MVLAKDGGLAEQDRRSSLAAYARAAVANNSPHASGAKAGSQPTSRASSQGRSPPASPKISGRHQASSSGQFRPAPRSGQPSGLGRRSGGAPPPPIAKAESSRRGIASTSSFSSSRGSSRQLSSAASCGSTTSKLLGAPAPPAASANMRRTLSNGSISSRGGTTTGTGLSGSYSSLSEQNISTDSRTSSAAATGPSQRRRRASSTRLGSSDVQPPSTKASSRCGSDAMGKPSPRSSARSSLASSRRADDAVAKTSARWTARSSTTEAKTSKKQPQPLDSSQSMSKDTLEGTLCSTDSSPMSVVTEAALHKSQYLLEQLADLKFGSEDEEGGDCSEAEAFESCFQSLRSEVRRAVREKDTVEVPAVLLRMLGEMWEQVRKEPEAGSATSPSPSQTPHSCTPPPSMLDDLRKLVNNPKWQSSKLSTSSMASTMLPSPAPIDGEASCADASEQLSRREWPRLSITAPAPASVPSSPCIARPSRVPSGATGVVWPTYAAPYSGRGDASSSPVAPPRSASTGESAVIAALQQATVNPAGTGYPSPVSICRASNPARQVAAEVAAAVARAVPPHRVQSMAAFSGAQSVTVTTTVTPTQVTSAVRAMGQPITRCPPARSLQRVQSVPTYTS